MPARRVVVDGSNIATEGRTLPSLRQLNEAVLAFLNEYPDSDVTVVVDATFGHRIEASDVAEFEAAEANNELVSPPAGAIGRGDAFLLRIAGKIGATVLSNDSFQEFHAEHEWLFDDDRLIGGKPIPGVGWIFTPRTPVRGAKSRKAVKDAKKRVGPSMATSSGEALGPAPTPRRPPPRSKDKAKVEAAIATATEEAVDGGAGGRKRRRKKRGARPAEPVNEAMAFMGFIEAHPLGSQVDGEVETFTSHGAFIQAGGARCYVPISALGDPPPRAARDVLNKGEVRAFVVQAVDPMRRGIELALPGFAHVSGAPSAETIEAEIREARASEEALAAAAAKPVKKARKKAVATQVGRVVEAIPEVRQVVTPAAQAPQPVAEPLLAEPAVARATGPAGKQGARPAKKAARPRKAATTNAATTNAATTNEAATNAAATKAAASRAATSEAAAPVDAQAAPEIAAPAPVAESPAAAAPTEERPAGPRRARKEAGTTKKAAKAPAAARPAAKAAAARRTAVEPARSGAEAAVPAPPLSSAPRTSLASDVGAAAEAGPSGADTTPAKPTKATKAKKAPKSTKGGVKLTAAAQPTRAAKPKPAAKPTPTAKAAKTPAAKTQATKAPAKAPKARKSAKKAGAEADRPPLDL